MYVSEFVSSPKVVQEMFDVLERAARAGKRKPSTKPPRRIVDVEATGNNGPLPLDP